MEFLISVLKFIGIMAMVLAVFNIVIIVHEYGHFFAGRWRGLKIEKFQIWFGKTIWSKEINGVQWGLGSIPAGGFVALPQMAPMDGIEGDATEQREQLPPISPLDKIIVAVAGPLFSLGLAFVFAGIVYIVGKPESESVTTTTVGIVGEGSPAEAAGFKVGDTILSVDGTPVKQFEGQLDSVRWAILASTGESIEFEVERGGETLNIEVTPEKKGLDGTNSEDRSFFSNIFKRPDMRFVGIGGKSNPVVAQVQEFSPAAEAGIEENDLLLAADGIDLTSLGSLSQHIAQNPGKEILLQVQRGEETLDLTMTPRLPDQRPADWDRELVGIVYDLNGSRTLVHPTPWEQVGDGLRTMTSTLGALFTPKSDIGVGHLSGPAGIMRVYYTLFQDPDRWRLVLWFSVILNVNLAVLNMLPFPVLDGGHITMAIIEAIRRRPLPIRVLETVQMACVLLLFSFIGFVTLKDAGDIFGGGGGGGAAGEKIEIKFLPPDQR